MGASGDMLMAALYELLEDKRTFRERMEQLQLPGVSLDFTSTTKCGIKGTRISVKVGGAEEKSEDVLMQCGDSHAARHHEHSNEQQDEHEHIRSNDHAHDHHDHDHYHSHNHNHNHNHDERHIHSHDHHTHHDGKTHSHRHNGRRYGYNEILELIRGLDLPESVLENALGVYRIIGEAEAAVHGVPLHEIHLHEIGFLDAVADVVGCSLLIDMLGVTMVTASPVHVGFGSIRCEHGILPVPAPAAAEILKGIPVYGGRIEGELCTPTGAALLKRFASKFGDMPVMRSSRIGYGMGAKDFAAANCLRAFLYEDAAPCADGGNSVYEISCNLDDMTPEAIGAVFGTFLDNGALDIYATPIMMKKNRPAVLLSCLCAEEKREELAKLMLEHTSTLGVRITECRRKTLERSVTTVETEFGEIRIKCAHGHGLAKCKPEYEDVLAAARKYNAAFTRVYDAALRAWHAE